MKKILRNEHCTKIASVFCLFAAASCGTAATPQLPDGSTTGDDTNAITSPTEEPAKVNPPFGYAVVDAAECDGEAKWSLGNVKNGNMHPGNACMQCHADEHEAPEFGFAGTVYKKIDDADDCIGQKEVDVIVVDANGVEFSDMTNSGGNFYLRARSFSDAVTPLTARIEVDGVAVAEMTDPVPSGDCNSCHTPTGTNDAPGRIIIPE